MKLMNNILILNNTKQGGRLGFSSFMLSMKLCLMVFAMLIFSQCQCTFFNPPDPDPIPADPTPAADTDGDGIIDKNDLCIMTPDNWDGSGDADSDGCRDDSNEDLCINDATSNAANSDNDKICDLSDNCDDDDNENQADFDGNGEGDVCDDDDDGDNVLDEDDLLCPNSLTTSGFTDADMDGCLDNGEDICTNDAISNTIDTDGDNICDPSDNCAMIFNENQADYDSDGEGDVCDNDIDGDNVLSGDLCIMSSLPWDGTGDADNDGCRDDNGDDLCLNYNVDNTNPDMDGICDSDARDLCPSGSIFTVSDNTDADMDGCLDSDEDLCPNYNVDNTNPDMDGICDSDARDLCPSGSIFTVSDNTDADMDGCLDSDEDECRGDATSNSDLDGDDHCDPIDVDDDNDGLIELDGNSISYMANDLDGSHYDDELSDTDTGTDEGTNTGCPSAGCDGYEILEDVTIVGSNWPALGSGSFGGVPFTADFNGNDNTITLSSDITGNTSDTGLFAYVKGDAKISNFTLSAPAGVSVNVKNVFANAAYVGSVVGRMIGSGSDRPSLDSIHVERVNVDGGSAKANSRFGGLIGQADYADIMNSSYKTADLKVTSASGNTLYMGVLIGTISNSTLKNSYSTGNIKSKSGKSIQAGGLVGYMSSSSISDCYATGNVESKGTSELSENLGGLIGSAVGGSIENSYYTGSLVKTASGSQPQNVGAIAGYINAFFTITAVYYDVAGFTDSFDHTPVYANHSEIFGYTVSELQTPTDTTLTFTPAAATTEHACVYGLQGTWDSGATPPCDTMSTTFKIYDAWSTDNWDFRAADELPILKSTTGVVLPGQ